jgi:hypothetical protein
MPQWIGCTREPLRLPELQGRIALVLVYYGRPHSSLVIGVRGREIEDCQYFRCEVCTRMSLPTQWVVSSELLVEVRNRKEARLVDESAGVLIECGAIALLDIDDARHFAGRNTQLRRIIENLM